MKELINPLNTMANWKKNKEEYKENKKSLNKTRQELYLLAKHYNNMGNKEMGDFLFEVYLYLCDYRNLLFTLEEHIDKANPHGY